MLGIDADGKPVDDFESFRVDDGDIVGLTIGNVDAREMLRD